MSGRGTERPDEVIEHGPVTLRRYRPDDVDALFGAVTASLDHLRPWMPWAAAADVAHALEDDARRDPGPQAVPDAELPFGDQVHDVVRQP